MAVFVFVIFQTGISAVFASEYMTVEDYHRIHPEQTRKTQVFNRKVAEKGVLVAKGIQKRLVKITFIYPGIQVSDYWRRSVTSFKKRMDEIRIHYELKEYHTKGGAVDLQIQRRHLANALKHKPDYLVYTLNLSKHRRFIERIITLGTPKLIIQNLTTPLRRWEGKQPFLYVGFDHAKGTEILAEHLLKKTGSKGTYSVLYYSPGYVSEMRGDTLIQLLNRKSTLTLKSSYYTNGQRTKAKQATLDILKEGGVDFIYACSTDIAFGALDALKATGNMGKVLINGWGGGSSELNAIFRGELDFTVMRMNDDNGVAMAEAIRLDVEGRIEEIPLVYSGEMVLVKKGADSNHLEKLRARAFRYSDNK